MRLLLVMGIFACMTFLTHAGAEGIAPGKGVLYVAMQNVKSDPQALEFKRVSEREKQQEEDDPKALAPLAGEMELWSAVADEGRQLTLVQAYFGRHFSYDKSGACAAKECWQTLPEFLKSRRGDCNSFAFGKLVVLEKLGYTDASILILRQPDAHVPHRWLGHAVVQVGEKGKTYILDSLHSGVISLAELKADGWQILTSINDVHFGIYLEQWTVHWEWPAD